MKQFYAIYLREMIILRRKLWRQLASMSVSPALYLVAFGFGMGSELTVAGRPYMEFLIPGLVAMSSMIYAFGIASEINIARFYWRIFEEFQAAPIHNISYVAGEVLAGMTRAFISVLIIIIMGYFTGVSLNYNVYFWLAVFLNSFLFSSLAIGLAMVVKSHADQSLLTNFFITPMAFLGGTFFPVENMPWFIQKILYFIPLTHASAAIRGAAYGESPVWSSYLLLAAGGMILFFIAFNLVHRARD